MKQVKMILAAAVAGGLMVGSPALAQQDQSGKDKGPSGEAFVRQIDGPEVQVKQGQTPEVVAFFPGQAGAGGAQPAGYEVTIVERPSQQAQGQNQNVGSGQDREIIFADASAVGGVVRYDFQNGPYASAAHKLVLTARKLGTATGGANGGPSGDQTLQLQQVGGSGDLFVFKVMPPPPTDAEKKQQQQEMEAKQKQAEQQHQAATRAATQPGGQPAPAMEQVEPKQEQTPAIITVYLAPAAS